MDQGSVNNNFMQHIIACPDLYVYIYAVRKRKLACLYPHTLTSIATYTCLSVEIIVNSLISAFRIYLYTL